MSALKKIGVIGAGQMGAASPRSARWPASTYWSTTSRRAHPVGPRHRQRQHGAAGRGGKLTEDDRTAALARIAAAETYDAFADADLVIEAATENEKVKREILAGLSKAQAGRCSPPTPRPSRSRGWPRPPTGRRNSSASTS
jgi:3-hydroxybutyryl-CoA dehydrogenase